MDTLVNPDTQSTRTHVPMVHLYCLICWPVDVECMQAICGKQGLGEVVPYDTDIECVVCADLEGKPCPVCWS